ncbi:MAG: hypothetical protein JXA53_07015 [Bacteroidales bacterium]|nr:hypothetical protein [Bacteroidales bacterium]
MKTDKNFDNYFDEISNNEEFSTLIDELITESLEKDFKPTISDSFADNVCNKITRKARIKENIEKQLVYFLTIIGIPSIYMFAMHYFNIEFASQYISLIFKYKIPIAFVIVCFLFIQLTDILTSKTDNI